jgi:capsular exopolysaccharide synthesis family protein
MGMELGAPAGTTTSLQELVEGPANLVGVLWRGRKLVASCVLACLGLAGLYLLYAGRLYQATAKLLVLQQGGRPLNVAHNDQSRLVETTEDIIPTHMMVVSSPMVVGRAIRSVGLNNLSSLNPSNGFDQCLDQAIKNLAVTRPDRLAKIIEVNYRAGTRREAVRTVQAVVSSYRTFLEDVYQKNNSEVVVLMTRARDDLNNELKELEQKYLEFHQKAPNLTTDGTGLPVVLRRIDEWVRASNETMSKAIHLKAQLELGRDLAKEGVGLWAIANAMDQVGDRANSNISVRTQPFSPTPPWDYLRELGQEQQQLTVQYGPQNTKVKELQEQISQVQEHSRSVRGRVEQTEIRDLLESTERSLKSVEAMRDRIKEQFDSDLVIARKTEIDLLAEASMRNNLERQRVLFNTVVDQLKQAKLVGDYSTIRSEIIAPASALPSPVRPLVGLTLALALVVGGAFGAGAALVSDLLDPRLRSPDEVRRVLRFPLLGQVPRLPDSPVPGAGPAGLISHVMPRSPTAESFKVVRANLDLSRRNQGVRVVLVTGPRSGEGKSTVASNLALCLAQVGRRVLLVDADLRRPVQHEIHGLRREGGLAQLLRELMPLERIVQATPIKNLEVITSGSEAPNPAELLSSPVLQEFLNRVRDDYDTVVIDSPSLLAVADPAILGGLVDGIVLVVRVAETKRDDAARSVEVLKGLGTPVLGVLINGTGSEPEPRRWVQVGHAEQRTDRYVREIRIDSQLIFVPEADYGANPGAAVSRQGPAPGAREENGQ